jgi:hypothetical protein
MKYSGQLLESGKWKQTRGISWQVNSKRRHETLTKEGWVVAHLSVSSSLSIHTYIYIVIYIYLYMYTYIVYILMHTHTHLCVQCWGLNLGPHVCWDTHYHLS